MDPFECLTFSLGFVHSGEKYNVIPEDLTFGGTRPVLQLPEGREAL
ncbi:hypothetical protein [Acidaminococcus sp.]